MRQLESPAIEEYVRGFGLHVGLKLLLPIVMPLKVGGAAASLASGNPFYFLFMLMLVPVLRTCITIWRMLVSQQSVAGFRQAILVGLLPVVGSLAFPVQMSARFTDLSLFLMRDFASRLGCSLPIYGGKDSRTELLAIKSVNAIAEGLDLWLAFTKSKRSAKDTQTESAHFPASRPVIRLGRWDHLAQLHLRIMEDARSAESAPLQRELQRFDSQSEERAA